MRDIVKVLDINWANRSLAQVIEYITLQLINAHKNATNASDSILNQYDFHIFPIVNPDGKSGLTGFIIKNSQALTRTRLHILSGSRPSVAQDTHPPTFEFDLLRNRHQQKLGVRMGRKSVWRFYQSVCTILPRPEAFRHHRKPRPRRLCPQAARYQRCQIVY